MAGDTSAYSALGLEPGADAAAIDRAYRKLIKRHHPNREGADAKRAAEINRAYRELRGRFLLETDTLILADDDAVADEQNGWVRAAMGLIIAVAALLAITGPVAAYIRALLPPTTPVIDRNQFTSMASATDGMDQPLHVAAIDTAVRQAVRTGHNDSAILNQSRECHRQLLLEPSVTQLDRCAAFDDAVVELQNRDPMWARGPFSELSVTNRQWSAASALSNDYLAIDSRLDRIRVHVELSLAPTAPAPIAPATALPSVATEPDHLTVNEVEAN